jgi:hypothetical protein
MSRPFLLALLIFLSFIFNVSSTIAQDADTLKKETPVKKDHGPRKAAIRSAIIPGLGQVYNKKYWKVPIIYAGGITIGLFYKYNQGNYIENRNALNDYTSSTGISNDATANFLRTERDQFREWRDWNIAFMAALYILNIVDANVDAHLKEFDIGDELALTVKPYLCQDYFNQPITGLSLNLKFKK